MSIKNIKPNSKGPYHQSYYIPQNENKYLGKYPIVCRSLLEKRFCSYLDLTENVKSWYSEPISIKYINKWDNKEHRYYPDFIFKINNKNVIVEVKSAHQLKKPKEPKKKTKKSLKNYRTSLKMYITNVSKIVAIRQYAKLNDYKFILVTERELKTIFK